MTLSARDVTVRIRGTTLVDEVSLDVAAGEVVALVGPNGAGKSTLLGALAGDRRLARGTIELDGTPIAKLSPLALAARRAVLAQRSELVAPFTAIEVVQLGYRISDAEARQLLAELELAAFADRVYPTLSGGEQQRVQLARVLAQLAACPGATLLLDEPLAALDPRHQLVACRRIHTAARAGHPVIMVVHDLATAARIADRIVVLARGRVVADGPPADAITAEVLERAFGVPFALVSQYAAAMPA